MKKYSTLSGKCKSKSQQYITTHLLEWLSLKRQETGVPWWASHEKKRLKTNEESLRELWDNIKCTNIHVIGVPEREEREKKTEKIFQEIVAENFPNMGKESLTQIQESNKYHIK